MGKGETSYTKGLQEKLDVIVNCGTTAFQGVKVFVTGSASTVLTFNKKRSVDKSGTMSDLSSTASCDGTTVISFVSVDTSVANAGMQSAIFTLTPPKDGSTLSIQAVATIDSSAWDLSTQLKLPAVDPTAAPTEKTLAPTEKKTLAPTEKKTPAPTAAAKKTQAPTVAAKKTQAPTAAAKTTQAPTAAKTPAPVSTPTTTDCRGQVGGTAKYDKCGKCGGEDRTLDKSGNTVACRCADANPALNWPGPCSDFGSCNANYECECNNRRGGERCQYGASKKQSLILNVDYNEWKNYFNRTRWECSIANFWNEYRAKAGVSTATLFTCGSETEDANVEVFKVVPRARRRAETEIQFRFLDTPACKDCAKNGEQVADKLEEIAKDTKERLLLTGIDRNIQKLAVNEKQPVPVARLSLSCETHVGKQCYKYATLNDPQVASRFLKYNSTAYTFSPGLPGQYTFKAKVQDRCQKHQPKDVVVRAVCPRRRPVAKSKIGGSSVDVRTYQFTRGLEIDLNAKEDSYSPGEGDVPLDFLWCTKRSDDMSGFETGTERSPTTKFKIDKKGRTQATEEGASMRFDVVLLVSDGCSYSQQNLAINVECNCPPRVHAGVSKTLMARVNQGPVVNVDPATRAGKTMHGEKIPRAAIGVDTTLSGKLSFNYEDDPAAVKAKLTDYALSYSWTLEDWTSSYDKAPRTIEKSKQEVHVLNAQNGNVLVDDHKNINEDLHHAHNQAVLAGEVGHAEFGEKIESHRPCGEAPCDKTEAAHARDAMREMQAGDANPASLAKLSSTCSTCVTGANAAKAAAQFESTCIDIRDSCYLKFTFKAKLPLPDRPKAAEPKITGPIESKLKSCDQELKGVPCVDAYDTTMPHYIAIPDGSQFWGRLAGSPGYVEDEKVAFDSNSTLTNKDAALYRGVQYNRADKNDATLAYAVNGQDDRITNPSILPKLAGTIQTAGFATRTLTKTRTETATETEVITQVPDPLPFCSVYLYNFQSRDAYFEMYPSWKQCQGVLKFTLTVDDGCTKSSDKIEIDVKCNNPPVAVACCDTTVAWASTNTENGFPTVTLDGRVRKSWDNKGVNTDLDTVFFDENDPAMKAAVSSLAAYARLPSDPNFKLEDDKFWSDTQDDRINSVMPLVGDYEKARRDGYCGDANTPCTEAQLQAWSKMNAQPAPILFKWSSRSTELSRELGIWRESAKLEVSISRPGVYKVMLSVDDGCAEATDDVTVEAQCIPIKPEIILAEDPSSPIIATSSGVGAPHYVVTTTGDQNGAIGTKMVFGIANTPTLYGARGEKNKLLVQWRLESYSGFNNPVGPDLVTKKPPQDRCTAGCNSKTCCSTTADSFRDFRFIMKGDYLLTVMVKDDCWDKNPDEADTWRTTSKIIRVVCSRPGQEGSEWSLASSNPFRGDSWVTNPIEGTLHPSAFVFNFDYTKQAYQTIKIKLPTNLVPASKLKGQLQYKFRVLLQDDLTKPLSSNCQDPKEFCLRDEQASPNPEVEFTPARFGRYIVRAYISDQCKTEVYDAADPIIVSCGSTPIPNIRRDTRGGTTGVSFDNFEYRVRYDNREVGFYTLRLSCTDSVLDRGETGGPRNNFQNQCEWEFRDSTKNVPKVLNDDYVTDVIPITPQRASGTGGGMMSGRVVEVITLRINDGCARDSQTRYANATIRAVCSRPALRLLPSVTREFAPTWRNRKTGFAPVNLKGPAALPPDSALKSGDFLSYQWCLVDPKTNDESCGDNQANAIGTIDQTGAMKKHEDQTKAEIYDGILRPVVYQPPHPHGTIGATSTYRVRLTISDGCQESDAFIFTVGCTCLNLGVNIVAKGADGFRIVRWDSTKNRFPDVEVHSALEYAGQYSELEYTWQMLTSPGHDLTCSTDTSVVRSQWGSTQTKLCDIPTDSKVTGPAKVEYVMISGNRYKQTTTRNTTYDVNETTSIKSVLTSLGSPNKLAQYKSDWMVFTPDLKGQYHVELTVSDGCQQKKTSISMYAACNDAPNPQLLEEVVFVSLDGQSTQFPNANGNQSRVFVDASRSRDPNDDAMTYHWTLFYSERTVTDSRAQRSYSVVSRDDAAKKLYQANWDGPVFSFVPDRQGSYIAQCEVHDGCSSVKVNASINVNCQRSTIAPSATVDMVEKFYTYKNDLSPRFGAPFYLNAGLSDDCAQRFVEKEERVEWEFVGHECIDPEVKSDVPTPAPVQTCNKNLAFDWTLEDKPCASKLSTVSIEDRNTDKATLHPDMAGTYKMRLTVKDLCSVDNSTVITVNAKCTSRLNVGVQQGAVTVQNDCTQAEALKFDAVPLTGTVTNQASGRETDFFPAANDDICRAPPTTPSPTAAPTFSAAGCCPTCTTCPKCSACPNQCNRDCNCGSTRGWQYECQPVTRAKTVLRRVSTLMEHLCIDGAGCTTTEVGTDYCPESCVTNPSCSCIWQGVMKNQTVDVEETACDWVRVPIQGVFNSYASKKQAYSRPTFKRMSMASKTTSASESPVSAAFIAVMSAICVMLISSIVLNVVYWRKIRALGDSMETTSVNISNLSSESMDSQ